ncbi:MAG: hypothetical protein ACHRHE_06890 [Tepidisphaerales bacterium]
MKYRVKGANRDTGEEIEIDVTASSDHQAMAVASKLQLLVESVELIVQPEATNDLAQVATALNPAAGKRLWSRRVKTLCGIAVTIGLLVAAIAFYSTRPTYYPSYENYLRVKEGMDLVEVVRILGRTSDMTCDERGTICTWNMPNSTGQIKVHFSSAGRFDYDERAVKKWLWDQKYDLDDRLKK